MKDIHTLPTLGDTYNLEIFMGKSKKKKKNPEKNPVEFFK